MFDIQQQLASSSRLHQAAAAPHFQRPFSTPMQKARSSLIPSPAPRTTPRHVIAEIDETLLEQERQYGASHVQPAATARVSTPSRVWDAVLPLSAATNAISNTPMHSAFPKSAQPSTRPFDGTPLPARQRRSPAHTNALSVSQLLAPSASNTTLTAAPDIADDAIQFFREVRDMF
jgi:hypothetical protein